MVVDMIGIGRNAPIDNLSRVRGSGGGGDGGSVPV